MTILLPEQIFMPPDSVTGIRFRLAKRLDYRSVHEACYSERALSGFHTQFHHLLDWQEDGRCYWLIGEDTTGQIVASGQLVLYPHSAELANLSVTLQRQGEGLGTALIQILTAMARYLRLPGLEIGVALANGRALALYRRLGFIEDRRIHLPNGDPAVILHKDL